MAKRSRVIIENNNNKHRSRLVQSLTALTDDTLYTTDKPSGVWGSTATIKSGGVTLKSSELDFEFDVPFDDDLEANEGEIIVYNLSGNTISQLKTNAEISIEAGYEGDTGLIYKGLIAKVSSAVEGADRVTTIKVIDKIPNNPTVIQSFSSGESTEKILTWLLKEASKAGLAIAKKSIQYSSTCENDVSIEEPLTEAIKTYSEACGVSTFINNGKVYSCMLDEVDDVSEFLVRADTGMIGTPKEFEEEQIFEGTKQIIRGYEVDMLLQHRISVGSKIQLMKKSLYGNTYGTEYLYVKSGSHRFNETECVTSFKAIRMPARGGYVGGKG